MYSQMRWVFIAILFSFLTLTSQSFAQQSQEAQKMDVLVGKWESNNGDGEATCEWLGETMVHCLSSWTNDEGKSVKALWILEYDQEADLYTSNRYHSRGYSDSGFVWVDGNSWLFVFNIPNGNRVKMTSQISEDNWAYKWHVSSKGSSWEESSEGSFTRVE